MQSLLATKAEVFDRATVLRLLDHDLSLLREIVQMFLEEAPAALGEIRAAVVQHHAGQLQRTAHRLKGSLGTFAAPAAVAAAQRLEEMGRQADLAGAEQGVDQLEQTVGELADALSAWVSEFHS